MFSDKGQKVYIFLRHFAGASTKFLFSWLEFCGIFAVDDEETFAALKESDIVEMKKGLRIEEKAIELVKKNVGKHLENYV